MSSAMTRGRTLDLSAVADATAWRKQRIAHLKDKLDAGTITMKERRELKWKWNE